MRLANSVALVTGAGSGIGQAIALLFAREGAALALLDRDAAAVEATAAAISAAGGRALAIRADIADQAAVEAAVTRTLEHFGQLDVLVNNAGISAPSDFIESAFDDWNRVIQVNLYGAIYCARAVAKRMVEQGRAGRIVNISSIHAQRAEPGASSYDIAKGGLDQLTRALAVELAPHGILVNSVAPGFIDTSMAIGPDGVNELETDWFQALYVARRKIPIARAGQPEEVAAAALFLASPEASYITGSVLAVDGGLSVTF